MSLVILPPYPNIIPYLHAFALLGSAKQSLRARERCTGATGTRKRENSNPEFFASHLGVTPRFLEKLENQLGACPRED
jgi:hypothetical protein